MSRALLNYTLLGVLVASAGVNVAIRPDLQKPNREFLPEMVRTAAYDSFAPNENFPDGKTLRRQVPGTVMRPERRPAVPVEKRAARGAVIFGTFCQPCHGAAGKGDGPVAMRGYPPPPSLLAANAIQMSDGEMFTILSNGRKNMPSYAPQIPAEDRWNAIAHVRSMQGKAAVK